jgi:hypothetical protein
MINGEIAVEDQIGGGQMVINRTGLFIWKTWRKQ